MCPTSVNQVTFWCFDHDISLKFESSICNSTSLCRTTTGSHPIIDVQLLTGPSASYSAMYTMLYTVTLCISGVLILLLLLAGDVETNPGPTGKYFKVTE